MYENSKFKVVLDFTGSFEQNAGTIADCLSKLGTKMFFDQQFGNGIKSGEIKDPTGTRIGEWFYDERSDKTVAFTWSTEDVQFLRPSLTTDEAFEVLESAKEGTDAGVGMNWGVLAHYTNDVFPGDRETELAGRVVAELNRQLSGVAEVYFEMIEDNDEWVEIKLAAFYEDGRTSARLIARSQDRVKFSVLAENRGGEIPLDEITLS